jgi:hypothetical protein
MQPVTQPTKTTILNNQQPSQPARRRHNPTTTNQPTAYPGVAGIADQSQTHAQGVLGLVVLVGFRFFLFIVLVGFRVGARVVPVFRLAALCVNAPGELPGLGLSGRIGGGDALGGEVWGGLPGSRVVSRGMALHVLAAAAEGCPLVGELVFDFVGVEVLGLEAARVLRAREYGGLAENMSPAVRVVWEGAV